MLVFSLNCSSMACRWPIPVRTLFSNKQTVVTATVRKLSEWIKNDSLCLMSFLLILGQNPDHWDKNEKKIICFLKAWCCAESVDVDLTH